MPKYAFLLLAPVLGFCLFTVPAKAELVEYKFEGVVTGVGASLTSEFSIGESVVGTYTFESTTPDLSPSATFGNYQGAQTGLSVSVGGDYDVSFVDGNTQRIIVNDDDPSQNDRYIVAFPQISISADQVAGIDPVGFNIILRDTTGTVFSSDLLPLAPPDASAFNQQLSVLSFVNGDRVNFSITSFSAVPEPSAFLMFGMALAFHMRRKRK